MVNNDSALDFIAFFDLVTQIPTENFNQVKRSGIGLGRGFELQLNINFATTFEVVNFCNGHIL